jgi:hypothetical protein
MDLRYTRWLYSLNLLSFALITWDIVYQPIQHTMGDHSSRNGEISRHWLQDIPLVLNVDDLSLLDGVTQFDYGGWVHAMQRNC